MGAEIPTVQTWSSNNRFVVFSGQLEVEKGGILVPKQRILA